MACLGHPEILQMFCLRFLEKISNYLLISLLFALIEAEASNRRLRFSGPKTFFSLQYVKSSMLDVDQKTTLTYAICHREAALEARQNRL